jgi:DNA-binding MarR family transcriptional regulator
VTTAKEQNAHQLAASLRTSLGMVLRRLRQTRDDGELTLPESTALARLDRGGPATAAELARLEQISPQSMGTTLAALQERGLVERRPDPQDGRRYLLSLSPAGIDVLGQRRSARLDQLATALSENFNPAERALLAEAAPLLERLAEVLQPQSHDPHTPTNPHARTQSR